jgi:hypothetical protein
VDDARSATIFHLGLARPAAAISCLEPRAYLIALLTLASGAIRQWFGGAARGTHRQGRLCYYFQRDFGIAIEILFRQKDRALILFPSPTFSRGRG